jgi:hypothetical protein
MGIQIGSWKRPTHLKASTQQPKFHREWNSLQKRPKYNLPKNNQKTGLLHFLLALHRVQNFIKRVFDTT